MSEIAILMAAGFGTRMRPLTESVPKPLIKVHGKPMIETVIDGLRQRGVRQFIVVVGYLGDQFGFLAEKYDNVSIVENRDYASVNNISSIYMVSDILINTGCDCFICEADLYVRNAGIFDTKLDQSCYFGKMVTGYSNDWVFDVDENGRITRIGKGGDSRFNMVGIAYFLNSDVHKLGRMIREAYGVEGYKDLFWDDVVNRNLDELDLGIHEIGENSIFEIDTVEELAAIDSSYKENRQV